MTPSYYQRLAAVGLCMLFLSQSSQSLPLPRPPSNIETHPGDHSNTSIALQADVQFLGFVQQKKNAIIKGDIYATDQLPLATTMAQIAKDPQVQICALFADKRWVSAKKICLSFDDSNNNFDTSFTPETEPHFAANMNSLAQKLQIDRPFVVFYPFSTGFRAMIPAKIPGIKADCFARDDPKLGDYSINYANKVDRWHIVNPDGHSPCNNIW